MELASLLALDVGGGTQDLLLWQTGQSIESAVKMVLPAPTQVAARRIRAARAQGRAVFLDGWLMGGGAMHCAVDEHLAACLTVHASPAAAASLADDLTRVRAMGVDICPEAPSGALTVPTSDLDLAAIGQALTLFEVPMPERLAVALCDHGYSPSFSNRKFRFTMWRRFLDSSGRLADLIFTDPPPDMTRLAALKAQIPAAWLMDTAAAAAWGALQDAAVARLAQKGVCIVNLGNMHTVGFLVKRDKVLGIYEHHTGCLNVMTLADQVSRFIQGTLSDDEVFASQGHGCARLADAPTGQAWPVVITGPQRGLAHGLGWPLAMPHGDVMLSGCFGLLAAAQALARAGG